MGFSHPEIAHPAVAESWRWFANSHSFNTLKVSQRWHESSPEGPVALRTL
jgi:hypothetical protein